MFALFPESSTSRRIATENENSVTRKPTLSIRKPLIDCIDNLTQVSTPSIKLNVSSQRIFKETIIQSDIFVDFCSYKQIPDNYEDLAIPDQFLGEEVMNNIFSAFAGSNIPEPEFPNFEYEEPRRVDICFKFYDSILLDTVDIEALLNSELELLNEPSVSFDDFL